MRAKVFCMASPKGGSGKTVLTATFGTFLQSLGKKVLVVDTDAATNGLTLLYLKEVMVHADSVIAQGKKPLGIYEIPSSWKEPDIVVLANGMNLIPATYEFANTEAKSLEGYRSTLANATRSLRASYDYIFLDAQAGSDLFAHAALDRQISDEVIIVSEYDPMSAAGVERLKGLFREDLTYGRIWMLLNKMLPEFVQSFSDFLEVAKYLNPIPWDSDVVRSYARRKLALNLDETNEFTLAITRTLRTLLGDEIRDDIDSWLKERQMAIRAPIEQRYQDTEKELEGLLMMDRKLRLRSATLKLTVGFSLLIPFIVVFFEVGSNSDFAKSTLQPYITPIIAAALAIGVYFFLKDTFRDLVSFQNPSLDRIKRERRNLEERLQKLEALRQSDLEGLVKSKR
jgi:MinD-like ATPase involved in chromosome partitioning or flagellar assembly